MTDPPIAQKSRLGHEVSDETVAKYRAAQAFLWAEWVAALLMVASFTQLYWAVLANAYSGRWAVGGGLAVFTMGGFMFLRSHAYYVRLEFPWRKRWDNAAMVVAGAGAVFWLMFALLALLTWMGVAVLPS